MKPLALSSLQVKNFKAIRNSGRLKLTPLTAFIGHNGPGKSSLIEALETVRAISLHGLDQAMAPWHGFEYIHNPAVQGERQSLSAVPISFDLQGRIPATFKAKIEISADENYDTVAVQKYHSSTSSARLRESSNYITADGLTDPNLKEFVKPWQFLRLDPGSMTEPRLQRRSAKTIHLESNGANIAEYLLAIRELDSSAFECVSRTMDNKANLVRDCGSVAGLLLQECEHVLIIRDLFPPWRETVPCLHQDRVDIFDSLDDAGVDPEKVSLVCIREELEAWLLADKRALQTILGRMKHPHPLGTIRKYRDPDSIPQPKTKLMQLFQRELGNSRKYVDFRDAKRIAAAIPDFAQIRRSISFQRFHAIIIGL